MGKNERKSIFPEIKTLNRSNSSTQVKLVKQNKWGHTKKEPGNPSFKLISWNKSGDEAVREYKKGDEITAVVLQVDAERERISLGVKQIDEDPFNKYLTEKKKGAIVTGTVIAVDAKGATIQLAEEVEGYIRVADLSRDRIEDATQVVNEGDTMEAKYIGVDRKNRIVNLSIKAKDEAEEKEALFRDIFKTTIAPVKGLLDFFDLLEQSSEIRGVRKTEIIRYHRNAFS